MYTVERRERVPARYQLIVDTLKYELNPRVHFVRQLFMLR